MTSHIWQFEGTFDVTGNTLTWETEGPVPQSANAFQIQRSDGAEKPRPQSLHILYPGTGWLVEHHHDH